MSAGDVVSTAAGHLPFEHVASRLRSARRFIAVIEHALTENAFERADQARADFPEEFASALGYNRLRDAHDLRQELPHLTWSALLAYSFSSLERFLRDASDVTLRITGRPPVTVVRGPKIEGWLDVLGREGVHVRSEPHLTEPTRLRQYRNSLTHELELPALSGNAREGETTQAFDGSLQPTPDMVRSSLDAVEGLVAAVSYAIDEIVDRKSAGPMNYPRQSARLPRHE